MKINNQEKKQIIRFICDANWKGLINKLDRLKLFSKERGQIKIAKNKAELFGNNGLQYKGSDITFSNIEKPLNTIITNVNNKTMKNPKQAKKEADQAEKELMLDPSIDMEAKKAIIRFRKWCKKFPGEVDKLLKSIKKAT